MSDDRAPALDSTDAAIRTMFDRRARRSDADDLRAAILAATASAPQARGWRPRFPITVSRPLARTMVVVLMLSLLVAMGVVGAAVLNEHAPVPTGYATDFVRPFSYTAPADITFRQTSESRPELVAWAAGPVLPTPSDPSMGQPMPWEARGIVIASGMAAWGHGESRRFMLRMPPAEFLVDLRDVAHTPMGEIVETTLDGRAALTVTLPGTGGSDIHLTEPMVGLSRNYVLMNLPSRLIVADIDGTTVFIFIWARTADDLSAWLPEADEFVSSIRFRPADQP